MKEAMEKWLKRHQITFDVDEAKSLCNKLELDTEKTDGCYMLVADLEAGRIDEAEFTAGLATLTGKNPEMIMETLKGVKAAPSGRLHPPDVKQWLDRWVWGEKRGEIPIIPSKDIVEYLSQFRPSHPVLLYRAQEYDEPPGKALVSYTHIKEMAEVIAESSEELTGKEHIVVTDTIPPSKILVDFTMLPEYPEEYIDEVIIMREPKELRK